MQPKIGDMPIGTQSHMPAIGVTCMGRKEVLGPWIDASTSASSEILWVGCEAKSLAGSHLDQVANATT